MSHDQQPLPVVRACELDAGEPGTQWLIERLWARSAVGIVGGPPKSCKTWLALDMAVSLASATPCIGLFRPACRERVLLYAAEDSHAVLKQRLGSICRHRGLALDTLDLFVITSDHLRLDLHRDQVRLEDAVNRIEPALLLLDPLVRLHRINENDAGEVSELLDYLRTLQRRSRVAIALVHHTRKNGSAGHPGLALRGSSDIHAWADCSLYLRRKQEQLLLIAEHRASSSPDPVELRLAGGDHPCLEIVGEGASQPAQDLAQAVCDCLRQATAPMTRTALRQRLRTRNERLGKTLQQLEQQSRIRRSQNGWCIASPDVNTASTM
mgnify:CR=1 FL=1